MVDFSETVTLAAVVVLFRSDEVFVQAQAGFKNWAFLKQLKPDPQRAEPARVGPGATTSV